MSISILIYWKKYKFIYWKIYQFSIYRKIYSQLTHASIFCGILKIGIFVSIWIWYFLQYIKIDILDQYVRAVTTSFTNKIWIFVTGMFIRVFEKSNNLIVWLFDSWQLFEESNTVRLSDQTTAQTTVHLFFEKFSWVNVLKTSFIPESWSKVQPII